MKNIGFQLDNSYQQLPEIFYTVLRPAPVRDPALVICNDQLSEGLGLEAKRLQDEAGVEIFSGNNVPQDASSIAQAYAGHQFGHFTMLGDGRAILIGEHVTPEGERFDIQLKGAGRTPYSRGGDGRSALGPMLREYIISEAMHALGIPTTRGLAVVTTGESVVREMDYAGAILTRVASSHLRVGTFQFATSWGSKHDLQALADYAIERHGFDSEAHENPYLNLLETVVKRQAKLIAKWQLVGFVHGVMNTDNMTISGEAIDYGPCAFMDTYDPDTVFSSIDEQGRYAYGNQPYIGGWNLSRFAESLLPLLHDEEDQAVDMAQDILSKYQEIYYTYWLSGMRAKLGLVNKLDGDDVLIEGLLQLMHEYRADYTNTFIALTQYETTGASLFQSEGFEKWHAQWSRRLTQQQATESEVKQLMKKSNPAVIPRNHLVEEALEAAVEKADYSVMKRLLRVLAEPYAHTKKQEKYQTVPKRTIPYQTFCGT